MSCLVRRLAVMALGLGISLTGCTWGGPPSAAPKPMPPANGGPTPTRSGLGVLAFYDQTAATTPPNPFGLLKSHPGLVTDIAPFWYKVDAKGVVTSRPQGNVATLAAQQHLRLVPLFNNANGTDLFLHSAGTRHAAISHIVALVKSHHYAGVNIDFQGLKPMDRHDLTLFMDQLHQAMPRAAFISMSVVPLTNLNGSQSAYDYRKLDHVSQAMVLMAYDLHGNGTPPGPVSPIQWVSRCIQIALKAGVAPHKLYLGIADYGYDWASGSTKAATVPLKAMHAHQYGKYTWNPRVQEATVTYTKAGVKHVIWFVPDRGAVSRIKLAQRDHLGGVAFWRIGYEDARWWTAVAGALGQAPTTGAAKKAASSVGGGKTSPQHRGAH